MGPMHGLLYGRILYHCVFSRNTYARVRNHTFFSSCLKIVGFRVDCTILCMAAACDIWKLRYQEADCLCATFIPDAIVICMTNVRGH